MVECRCSGGVGEWGEATAKVWGVLENAGLTSIAPHGQQAGVTSSLTQHIQQLNDGGVASAMVHNNATPDLMGIRT